MRTNFYLSPHPNGGWLGKQNEEEHYLIVSPNKQDVLDHLINLCDRARPCTMLSRMKEANSWKSTLTEHSILLKVFNVN